MGRKKEAAKKAPAIHVIRQPDKNVFTFAIMINTPNVDMNTPRPLLNLLFCCKYMHEEGRGQESDSV